MEKPRLLTGQCTLDCLVGDVPQPLTPETPQRNRQISDSKSTSQTGYNYFKLSLYTRLVGKSDTELLLEMQMLRKPSLRHKLCANQKNIITLNPTTKEIVT